MIRTGNFIGKIKLETTKQQKEQVNRITSRLLHQMGGEELDWNHWNKFQKVQVIGIIITKEAQMLKLLGRQE